MFALRHVAEIGILLYGMETNRRMILLWLTFPFIWQQGTCKEWHWALLLPGSFDSPKLLSSTLYQMMNLDLDPTLSGFVLLLLGEDNLIPIHSLFINQIFCNTISCVSCISHYFNSLQSAESRALARCSPELDRHKMLKGNILRKF